MPLVMASAAPRRRVTVDVNGPAAIGATPSGSPHSVSGEPATPLHNRAAEAAEQPDASPTVVVHTFVEPIHLIEGDDDAPSTEASSFIEPMKRSPSPLLTARSAPLSKLALLLPLFFAALSVALWLWYLVAYLDELSGWDNASCDSTSGGSTALLAPGDNSTSVDSGILFPSSTGVAEASAASTRGEIAKIYHHCVIATQLIGVLGTLLFGFFLDRSSGWVSGLGVFLDALLLSVLFWGVYLYLSATVCAFAFFKVTLVYCVVQMAVLVGFVNTLASYQRARGRAEQTVVHSLPATTRNKSPTSGNGGGEGGRGGSGGVELARSSNGTGGSTRSGREAAADKVSGLPFSPTTNRARSHSGGASTLPTLQPFQHPAFPLDAPVPLFVVQMHPDQRAPAVAPLPSADANSSAAAATASSSSVPAAASSSSSGSGHSPASPLSADVLVPASVRSSPPAAAAAASSGSVEHVHELDGDVYDANQLQYQSV